MSKRFLLFPTKSPGLVSGLQLVSWHRNILACGRSSGDLEVFNDEGDLLMSERSFQKGQKMTTLVWNPVHKLLVTGWQNGSVVSWRPKGKYNSESPIHHSSIRFFKFSPDGAWMISADEDGIIGVWKVSGEGEVRISLTCTYHKELAADHCIFRRNHRTSCPVVFLFSMESGRVIQADNSGQNWMECFTVNGRLSALYYYDEKDSVIAVTRSGIIFGYKFGHLGRMEQIVTINIMQSLGCSISSSVEDSSGSETGTGTENSESNKESGPEDAATNRNGLAASPSFSNSSYKNTIWLGSGLIGICLGKVVKVVNIDTQTNFGLTCEDNDLASSEIITCLAYNERFQFLAGGTNGGKVVMWKHNQPIGLVQTEQDPNLEWEVIHSVTVGEDALERLLWAKEAECLVMPTIDGAKILSAANFSKVFFYPLAAFQVDSREVHVRSLARGFSYSANCPFRAQNLSLGNNELVCFNSQEIVVYKIPETTTKTPRNPSEMISLDVHSSFTVDDPVDVCVHYDTVYMAIENRIDICNVQGVVKQSLNFSETEGYPLLLNVNDTFLAVATDNAVVGVYNLSRREARTHGMFRQIDPETITEILDIRVNNKGNCIALLCKVMPNNAMSSKVYFYLPEIDRITEYAFDDNRVPITICWDNIDSRLIAVETKCIQGRCADTTSNNISTIFVTSEAEVFFQDSIDLPPGTISLIGIHAPYFYFAIPDHPGVKEIVLRDFTGMEDCEDTIRDAIVNFSFNLSKGDMNEAFLAVKVVRNPNVWTNMAHMMVKTRRTDMISALRVCLGNMSDALGAKALREAVDKIPEELAQLGVIAVRLGLYSFAEDLFRDSGRTDILNQYFQQRNMWSKAIELAQNDRIFLRSTHYCHARYLETVGRLHDAIESYELSETHCTEVPRMLFQPGHFKDLDNYIASVGETKLLEWRGRFLESKGQYLRAVECYKSAADYVSVVRVLCVQKNFEEAQQIISETEDKAALYHLGRQYENIGSPPAILEALRLYRKAGTISHAVRLAMEHDLSAQLYVLAAQSDQRGKIAAAKYFEDHQLYDKAVHMYHRSGNLEKAIDLCFDASLFTSLAELTKELGASSDPTLIARCVEYFLDNEQYDKAADLYNSAGQISKGLEICQNYDVFINEEMATQMTPPVSKDPSEMTKRSEILRAIAKTCKKQRSYHLSCKKYTEAGDKAKAMKALVLSGNTQKIIFFAGISRNREVYIIAANYLQKLDWRNSPEILKAVTDFYTKAKALESLASFYESCAQAEIDDFQAYDKALKALREAMKWMNKSTCQGKELMMSSLQTKGKLIERFLRAQSKIEENPSEMIVMCRELLAIGDVDSAVRRGDIFALMIESYYERDQYSEVHSLIEQMIRLKIDVTFYLDEEIVKEIYSHLGLENPSIIAPKPSANDSVVESLSEDKGDDDGIAEEINEEVDNDSIADDGDYGDDNGIDEEIDEEYDEEVY